MLGMAIRKWCVKLAVGVSMRGILRRSSGFLAWVRGLNFSRWRWRWRWRWRLGAALARVGDWLRARCEWRAACGWGGCCEGWACGMERGGLGCAGRTGRGVRGFDRPRGRGGGRRLHSRPFAVAPGCPRWRTARGRRRKLGAARLKHAPPCFPRDALHLGAHEVGARHPGPAAWRSGRFHRLLAGACAGSFAVGATQVAIRAVGTCAGIFEVDRDLRRSYENRRGHQDTSSARLPRTRWARRSGR